MSGSRSPMSTAGAGAAKMRSANSSVSSSSQSSSSRKSSSSNRSRKAPRQICRRRRKTAYEYHVSHVHRYASVAKNGKNMR